MKVVLPLLALAISLNVRANPLICGDVFAPEKFQHVFPEGVDPKTNPNGFMQIGYESEYLFSESAAILKDYCPKDIPYDVWLAKTDQQRLEWLTARFKDKPEHAAGSGLFKQVELSFMPNELLIDATGNVEVVLAPIDTYGEWEKTVDLIVARYGVGSQQAMLSKPRESAFKPHRGFGVRRLVKQSKGWFIFTGLRDMFSKLKSGAARFKKDPTKLSAQFMDHPFLGPMTKLKRDRMEQYLEANADGEMYDEKAKLFIRKSDASFKYTGGPAYRPDIAAPVRFSWETRNAHKDVEDLKMKVRRDLEAHEDGLSDYEEFADVPAFDSIRAFERFPLNVQHGLAELFPSKADPRFEYPEIEKRALETYRNFAFPLQSFHELAKDLTPSTPQALTLEREIEQASAVYLETVKNVIHRYKAGQISRDQAKAEIMGALCQWSVDSELDFAFDMQAAKIGDEEI